MKHNAKSVQRGRVIKAVSVAVAAAIGSGMIGCGAGAAPGNEEPSAEQPRPAEVSQELSTSSFEYEYYSDASYTTLVGFWAMSCGGATERYGTRTKYVIGDRENCKTGATVGCWEIINGQEYCGYSACVIC